MIGLTKRAAIPDRSSSHFCSICVNPRESVASDLPVAAATAAVTAVATMTTAAVASTTTTAATATPTTPATTGPPAASAISSPISTSSTIAAAGVTAGTMRGIAIEVRLIRLVREISAAFNHQRARRS